MIKPSKFYLLSIVTKLYDICSTTSAINFYIPGEKRRRAGGTPAVSGKTNIPPSLYPSIPRTPSVPPQRGEGWSEFLFTRVGEGNFCEP